MPLTRLLARGGWFASDSAEVREMRKRQASVAAGALVGAVSGLAAGLAALWFAQTAVPKALADVEGQRGRHVQGGRVTGVGLSLHASFAMLTGAVYGAAAEYVPGVTSGFGAAAGLALWAATEPIANEQIGLAEWPNDGSAVAMGSHVATYALFGVVLEGVRQVARLEFN